MALLFYMHTATKAGLLFKMNLLLPSRKCCVSVAFTLTTISSFVSISRCVRVIEILRIIRTRFISHLSGLEFLFRGFTVYTNFFFSHEELITSVLSPVLRGKTICVSEFSSVLLQSRSKIALFVSIIALFHVERGQ